LKEAQNEKRLQGTFIELLKIAVYRRNIAIMMIIWSFGSFAFFMVPFYLKNVKANIFMLSLATETAELLGSILCFFIQKCISLKKALILFSFMIAVSCFGMIFTLK
jgi:Na+/melibiose symporter-like transporter